MIMRTVALRPLPVDRASNCMHTMKIRLSNARTLKRMHFVVNPPVIRRKYEMSYLIGVVGFLRDTAHGKSARTPSAADGVIGIILA